MREQKEGKKRLCCPYCDEEIMAADSPLCQACRVAIFYCPRCREPLVRDNELCPHCGAEIQS